MSDVQEQDQIAEKHKPVLEIAELIKELEDFEQYLSNIHTPAEGKYVSLLKKLSALLKEGEPFHPDPLPNSGQGKWKETAKQMSNNADFYRGIVKEVGEILGKDAYISDDGSVQDSVLALKVPELVQALKEPSIYELAYNDHVNDRNHTEFGTRDYQTNPVKSFEHYLQIRREKALRKTESIDHGQNC